MQKVKVIVVGKPKEKYLLEASAEYEKRLSAFCRLELVELTPARLPENPSEAEIDKALEDEGARILKKAEGTTIVALCIEGQLLDSVGLSQQIAHFAQIGAGSLSLVVGSSHGLCQSVKSAAALRLSMSKMTFPHQLARVMLLEQLYRAFSIQNNSKYHK